MTKIKYLDLEGLLSKIHYSSTNNNNNLRINRKQVYLLLSNLQEILILVQNLKSIKSFKFKSSLLIQIFDELLTISQTDIIIIENFYQ